MIRSELLKLKRSAVPYLCLIAAIIVPFIFFLDISSETDEINAYKKDPWNLIIVECWKGMNFLVLPLFIILISTLVAQLEHRNNTWKQVHASPIHPLRIFLVKFLVIQMLIAAVLIIFNAVNIIMPLVLHQVNPVINIYQHLPDWRKIIELNYQTFIGVMGISAIQFFLGMQFKNVILPLALGFGLWLVLPVAIEMHWPHLDKFPFSYSVFILFPKYASIIPYIMMGSLGYALAFFSLTYLSFMKKKVKW
jgi:lantibiotic transport system permease protein